MLVGDSDVEVKVRLILSYHHDHLLTRMRWTEGFLLWCLQLGVESRCRADEALMKDTTCSKTC
uniref:Uncharacterized protein n=1 Tax=Hyaloperonospora arabidopsidis (strain Emoy2) TaxID=559515 RepID=M4C4U2_HYAAE